MNILISIHTQFDETFFVQTILSLAAEGPSIPSFASPNSLSVAYSEALTKL